MDIPKSINQSNVTQAFIQYLIECPKKFLGKRRKQLVEKYQQLEQHYDAESDDGTYRFRVFLRQNVNFPANFSVGLIYINQGNEDVLLFRCNGPHCSREGDRSEHFAFHTHTQLADDWARGSLTNPQGRSATEAYSVFIEAIEYFLQLCHLDDPNGILMSKVESPISPHRQPYSNQIGFDERNENE